MRRRHFIAGLGSAAAWPLVMRAQQPALPVIGFVDAGSAKSSARYVTAFRKALGETGYVEGRNGRVSVWEGHWMNAKLRHFAFWVVIILLLLALFTIFQNRGQRSVSQDISLSQFLNDVDQGKIRDVVIQGQEIRGTYVDGHRFDTYVPNDPTLLQRLYGKNITIAVGPSQDNLPWFVSLLVSWLPFLLTIALWIWSVRMISRALRTPDGRSIGQVVDECGSELRKSNDRLERLLNDFRPRSDAS